MKRSPECRHCETPMEAGFILDRAHSTVVQPVWVEGEPEVHKAFGLQVSGTLDVRGRERRPVTTYRCPTCGALESYAMEVKRRR